MRKSYSRALSLILAVLMLVGQMVFVASAEQEYVETECTCDEATRTGEINYTVPPTCNTYGMTEYICNECGGFYQELGDPPTEQHEYNIDAATCTTDKKCTLCQTVFESKLGHDFSVDVPAKDATCTSAGYTAHKKCSRCSAVQGKEIIPALGHEWGEPVIDQIQECYTAGSQTAHCTREGCDATNKTAIPSYRCHVNYVAVRTEPTCTENAKLLHTCSLCGFELLETLYGEGNEPTNHADAVRYEGKAATCTEKGWDAYIVCSCGYSDYVEISPLGHDIKTVEVAATCSSRGYKQDVCQREGCGYVSAAYDITDIDHSAHKLSEDSGKKTAPTCTAPGVVNAIVCTECNKVLVESHILPPLGHSYEDYEGKDATCTEKGWEPYQVCTRCGDSTYKEINALGHQRGQSLGTTQPTCTEQGYDIWQCQRCKNTFRDNYTDAKGHTFDELVEAREATCLTDGWEEHYKCSACDNDVHNYGENNELYIEAFGHDIVEVDAAEATCVSVGFDAYEYCTRCDYTTYNANSEVPAFGHTEATREVAETAEQVGYIETYCTVCDTVLGLEYTDDRVEFTYAAYGINGSDKAVNSGMITVEVYADVKSSYARIWGVDIALMYNQNLTFIEANGALFNTFTVNSFKNDDGSDVVKFTADNGQTEGTKILSEGKYLIATLTFKVSGNFYSADAEFTVIADDCNITRETNIENAVEVSFGEGAVINVAMLGDADRNGKINNDDTLALYEWFLNADVDEYNYVFDMDKDGSITGDDFAYLRGAIVRDNAYLES